MKNLLKIILFPLLISSNLVLAQVIISPYIVYMDEQNKFGSMIVQNESFEPYEISVSFIFGYPISDSLGNRTMKYEQNPSDEMPSINNWVKAFPKKFVLKPKERQTIRLMLKPPAGLEDGTYWTRIVTSSTPVESGIDTSSTGVSAKLKFVLNQVTTAIYRKNNADTDLTIGDPELYLDSTNTYQLLYPLNRERNSPFFGYLNFRIFNEKGELLKEEKDYLSIYFDLVRNYVLQTESFPSGLYRAELEIEFNEKEDIPESKMIAKSNVIKYFEFSIP
jgi:P pilus assembly chaperone PapD